MRIRRMMAQDLKQVAAIEEATFSEPWSVQGFADTLAMENVLFLVAEQENTICGYCGIYLAADEGEITNVAVSSEYRRQGIGSRLVEEILSATRELGTSDYFLEVRISNQSAISLYEQHGFTIEGRRRNFYRMPTEDAYIMCAHQ